MQCRQYGTGSTVGRHARGATQGSGGRDKSLAGLTIHRGQPSRNLQARTRGQAAGCPRTCLLHRDRLARPGPDEGSAAAAAGGASAEQKQRQGVWSVRAGNLCAPYRPCVPGSSLDGLLPARQCMPTAAAAVVVLGDSQAGRQAGRRAGGRAGRRAGRQAGGRPLTANLGLEVWAGSDIGGGEVGVQLLQAVVPAGDALRRGRGGGEGAGAGAGAEEGVGGSARQAVSGSLLCGCTWEFGSGSGTQKRQIIAAGAAVIVGAAASWEGSAELAARAAAHPVVHHKVVRQLLVACSSRK